MKLHATIIDDFFARPEALRHYAIAQEFGVVEGPIDKVKYEGIAERVPQSFLDESRRAISKVLGGAINIKFSCMRISIEGSKPPHWAHTDLIMSQYLAIVYLDLNARGGTVTVAHESGMKENPIDESGVDIWREDTNNPAKWQERSFCSAEFNRCLIVPCNIFHAAIPQEGYGTNSENGRLVLIMFFDVEG